MQHCDFLRSITNLPNTKLSRSAFFYCEKCIPNKMHPSTPQTTTLEIIQAYFKQINPPPGAQIKKQIKHASLKIQFQVGLFHAKLLNSPNNIYPPPLQPLPFNTHNTASGPKFKNSHAHFCLPRQILSKMVWHNLVASKTTKLSHFRHKAWMQAMAYPIETGRGTTHPKVTAD